MLLLAWKHLIVHKGRFLLAIAGVACAVVLELLLMSLYAGWRDNMKAYLRHVQADLWIGQQGAYDLFNTLSLLPQEGADGLRDVDGVREVSAFVGRLMTCEVAGKQRYTFIVGVEREENGPVDIIAGRPVHQDGEIVIDRVFARKEGLRLGDTIMMARQALTVVGIARGGNAFIYQYAFTTLTQARQLLHLQGLVNFFLVRLSPTINGHALAAQIEQYFPQVSVVEKDQFITDNLRLPGDSFLPILRVLEGIGWLVGTVMIGLAIYTLTLERAPEYAVLKALGAPDRTLYGTVSLQALTCGLLGWLLGVPLSWVVISLAQSMVPQFPAALYLYHTLWMFAGMAGMSLLAALVPAWRLSRVDPLIAFKS
jgi:putative ABC transport system permease protein